MKNKNQYHSPVDKMSAWEKWCENGGCEKCGRRNDRCHAAVCFMAWLHSPAEKEGGVK
jgi:hypothetical protein